MDEPLDEDVAPPPPRKRKRRPWFMPGLLLIVALSGFLILHNRQKTTVAAAKSLPPQSGVSISTAVAEQGNIGVYINALGSVAPLSTGFVVDDAIVMIENIVRYIEA